MKENQLQKHYGKDTKAQKITENQKQKHFTQRRQGAKNKIELKTEAFHTKTLRLKEQKKINNRSNNRKER